MKIIYLENTLNLLSQIEGIDIVNNLVQLGVVKEVENENGVRVKYLVIDDSLL